MTHFEAMKFLTIFTKGIHLEPVLGQNLGCLGRFAEKSAEIGHMTSKFFGAKIGSKGFWEKIRVFYPKIANFRSF